MFKDGRLTKDPELIELRKRCWELGDAALVIIMMSIMDGMIICRPAGMNTSGCCRNIIRKATR